MDDLKRLVNALQDLISKREKSSSLGNPLGTVNITKPSQVKVQNTEERKTTPQNYTGSGRIVPYEDLSGTVSKIFSNGRL